MVFSNPFMYETHMQIMSDALISEDGILGTVKKLHEPQYPYLYYAHRDLTIPHSDPEMPALRHRFSLGAFTRSFEEVFSR
jgi:hypothetical protein